VQLDCAEGVCRQRLSDSRGNLVAPVEEASLPSEDGRLRFVVATWNHLFRLRLDAIPDERELAFPLRFLDGETYRQHKYARKSQGDYATRENPLLKWLAIIGLFVLQVASLWLVRRKGNREVG